jgi:hypothetical protein
MARVRPSKSDLNELTAQFRNNEEQTSVFSFGDFRYPENGEDPETSVRFVTSLGREKFATWRIWV